MATYPASTQPTTPPTTAPLQYATLPPTVRVERDVAYNDLEKLDVYAPKATGVYPVVVMYPGRNSDKTALSNLAGAVSSAGAVVFAVSYRGHDDQLSVVADARCAAWYAAAHGREYGGEGSTLVLVGVSTGAHLAFGEGFDGPWKKVTPDSPCRAAPGGSVRAVVGIVGAYNTIDPTSADYATFSPFSQAGASPGVAVRLVEGTKDKLQVDRAGTEAFRDVLTGAGHAVSTTFSSEVPNLALVGLQVDATSGQLAPIGPNDDRTGLALSAREVIASTKPG